MDYPLLPLPPPIKGNVKLDPEHAYLYLVHVEEDWCMLFNYYMERLKPEAETAIHRYTTYLAQLKKLNAQCLSGEEDFIVSANKVWETTIHHSEWISNHLVLAQTIAVKIPIFDCLIRMLVQIYYSEFDLESVTELLTEIQRTKDWLLDIRTQLDRFQLDCQELLFDMMAQMAAKMYSSLKVDEITALAGKIEIFLVVLEKADTPCLPDLQEAGKLIQEFEAHLEQTGPMVKALGKIRKITPPVCTQTIPALFRSSGCYFLRYNTLYRRYHAKNTIENKAVDSDLDELDIFNVEKFNWRRFRDEFYHYFYLKDKTDFDAKILTTMFGKGYRKAVSFTFIRSPSMNPLDIADELVSPMLVNFPSCPHDIPQAKMVKLGNTTMYSMPSVDLSSKSEYCDGMVYENCVSREAKGPPSEVARIDTDISESAISDDSSDLILYEPRISLILNPRGFEKMREHIYNLFVAALRNKNTAIILASASCASCQMNVGQVASLFRDAATVFAGRGLLQVYICDPELLKHLVAPKSNREQCR